MKVLANKEKIEKKAAELAAKEATEKIKRAANKFTHKVFFDLKIGQNKSTERVVFGLYGHYAPENCENFRSMCNGLFTCS